MFVVGNFIAAIARILDLVLTLYLWIVYNTPQKLDRAIRCM